VGNVSAIYGVLRPDQVSARALASEKTTQLSALPYNKTDAHIKQNIHLDFWLNILASELLLYISTNDPLF